MPEPAMSPIAVVEEAEVEAAAADAAGPVEGDEADANSTLENALDVVDVDALAVSSLTSEEAVEQQRAATQIQALHRGKLARAEMVEKKESVEEQVRACLLC